MSYKGGKNRKEKSKKKGGRESRERERRERKEWLVLVKGTWWEDSLGRKRYRKGREEDEKTGNTVKDGSLLLTLQMFAGPLKKNSARRGK